MGNLWGVGLHADFTSAGTPDSISAGWYEAWYYMPNLVYIDQIPTHPSFKSRTKSLKNKKPSWK